MSVMFAGGAAGHGEEVEVSQSSGPESAAPPLLPGDAERPPSESRPVADWTLADVVELARDCHVQCDGDPGAIARVMAAVEPVAAGLTRAGGVASGINNVHIADRAAVVDTWREARTNPGAIAEVDARIHHEGVWKHSHQRMLSLLEHPELPVFLVLGCDYEPIDATGLVSTGEATIHGQPARWTLVRLRPDGRVEDAYGTVAALLGTTADELRSTLALDLIYADDRPLAMDVLSRALTDLGTAVSVEHRLQRRDGDVIWVESTLLVDFDEQHVDVLIVDIAERRTQRLALQASREETRALAEEFRLLADEIPSGAFRADADGKIQFCNAQFVELAGGRSVSHLHDIAHAEDHHLVDAALKEVAERQAEGADGTVITEFRASGPHGGMRSLRIRVPRTPVGVSVGMVGVLLDTTSTVELLHQARTDQLTGLLNRSALDTHIEELLDRGDVVAAMFIDFDHFKAVNDTYGHHAGDEVLRVIGKRLRGCVRPTEVVARYGGDEFVVVCTNPDHETLTNLFQRVQDVLGSPVRFDDGLWPPSASVGIALSDPDDGPADVLRRADHQMYVNKRARRVESTGDTLPA